MNGIAGSNGHIAAVIFDLDGVLMDTEWIAFHVWRKIAAEYGGELLESAFPRMAGLTAEETAQMIAQECQIDLPVETSVARAWREVTAAIDAGIEPLPGARDLLTLLHSRGLPLAVASNSPRAYILNALRGLGLRDFFVDVVGVDQVAQGKPAPDIYLAAAARLGIAAHQCAAVEDSLVGSLAAHRAGMRVLGVPSQRDDPARFAHCYRLFPSLVQVAAQAHHWLEAPV